MKVLVLHSDIPPDAPADDQDTIIAAHAVGGALRKRGHDVSLASFQPQPAHLDSLLAATRPDAVFNLVESVFGLGELASIAPTLLAKACVPYTGSPAGALALAGDKVLAKEVLRAAGLPTAPWSVPPHWADLRDDLSYVVKSVTEDASLGLDDEAMVPGAAVPARAAQSAARHGGRWFAESYLEGREFNISVLGRDGDPVVLPIPEMVFENWSPDRPRIVGYAAKWDDSSADSVQTVRKFGIEASEPALACRLVDLVKQCWKLFGLRGFARVDFRMDAGNAPFVLEINPNPCIEPSAGFAAAAAMTGFSYEEAVERILLEAAV